MGKERTRGTPSPSVGSALGPTSASRPASPFTKTPDRRHRLTPTNQEGALMPGFPHWGPSEASAVPQRHPPKRGEWTPMIFSTILHQLMRKKLHLRITKETGNLSEMLVEGLYWEWWVCVVLTLLLRFVSVLFSILQAISPVNCILQFSQVASRSV